MARKTYTLTGDELYRLLNDVQDLRDEYVSVHGYTPVRARAMASLETMEGLDADREIKEIERQFPNLEVKDADESRPTD